MTRFIIPAAAALVLLSACGNETSPTPQAPGQMAQNVTVEIQQGASTKTTDAFGTNPLVIAPGTTVTWVNHDTMDHTVTADDGSFDSGEIEPNGGTFQHTFGDANTMVHYHCTIHPNMVGTVQVSMASPSPSPSPSPTVNVTIQPGASTRTTDAFGTNPLMVAPGTTVLWTNNDNTAHTVTSDNGEFDSGSIAPNGGTFEHTFDEPNESYPYHCTIHPNMKGTVQVSGPSPSPSPSQSPSPSPSP